MSGADLGDLLGMSRVAARKNLEALRAAGYPVAAEKRGYRLDGDGDFLYPWEFPGLEDRVVHYDAVASTMDEAFSLAASGAADGTVAVAESQKAGRGRRGRSWASGRGGLFFTLVLRPALDPDRALLLTARASAALALALRDLTGEPFVAEWPNDVYLEGRKAAGILCEYFAAGDRLRFADLGVGVNVANAAPEGGVSLADLGRPAPRRREVLSAFLSRLASIPEEGPGVAAAWKACSGTPGRRVASARDGRVLGAAAGLDESGRLLVDPPSLVPRGFGPAEALVLDKEKTP